MNKSNPTTVEAVLDRIDLYFDTIYNQNKMRDAILGKLKEDKRVGGLVSRLNATFEHGGRLMNTLTRATRYAANPVPIIGPYNRPL